VVGINADKISQLVLMVDNFMKKYHVTRLECAVYVWLVCSKTKVPNFPIVDFFLEAKQKN
jgi:hypothetical protein